MCRLRNFLFFFAMLVVVSGSVNECVAQLHRLEYKVGDLIEVEFMGEWHEAKVTKLLPGGRALKAEFSQRLERGPREFMFTSRSIRDIEVDEEAADETDSEENPFAEEANSETEDENPFVEDASRNVEKEVMGARRGERGSSKDESNPFADEDQPKDRRSRRGSDRTSSRSRAQHVQPPPTQTRRTNSVTNQPPERSVTKSAAHEALRKEVSIPSGGISTWRWVSFGTLLLLGTLMSIWGWVNRTLYW